MRCSQGHHFDTFHGADCPDCRADWDANGTSPDPYIEAQNDPERWRDGDDYRRANPRTWRQRRAS